MALLVCLSFGVHGAESKIVQGQHLRIVELLAGMNRIHAEIADSDESQHIGLMFRKKLAPDNGMLFVYHVLNRQCMYMRNTLVPLSVAFIDEDGAITNIEEMKPKTVECHWSLSRPRFALEMNSGWFKRHGVSVGSHIVVLRNNSVAMKPLTLKSQLIFKSGAGQHE